MSFTFDFFFINKYVTGSAKTRHFGQKLKLRYRLPELSHPQKFFLSPIFVLCRISLSDPYSKSMPNFKCQNNLKDLKRAVERQATFYSLSFSKYNKRGMGGASNKQLKKTA